MNKPIFFDNPYPSTITQNVDMQNIQNAQSENQSQNFTIQKLLPLILSKKDISEILPTLFSNNPLLCAIMSNIKTQKTKTTNAKIQSDKIDTSNLQKIT